MSNPPINFLTNNFQQQPIPDTMGLVLVTREDGRTHVHKIDNVELLGFHYNEEDGTLQFLGKVLSHPSAKTSWICQTTEKLDVAEVFANSPKAEVL